MRSFLRGSQQRVAAAVEQAVGAPGVSIETNRIGIAAPQACQAVSGTQLDSSRYGEKGLGPPIRILRAKATPSGGKIAPAGARDSRSWQ